MRSVTAKTTGLRTDRRISHVFVMDVPSYANTLFITDAAINIFPDLDTKRDIIQNAIDLFTQIGLGVPKVAILSAVETVTTKIRRRSRPPPSARWPIAARSPAALSTDRSRSTMPSTRKQRGSKGSIRRSPAMPEILVVPNMESGNMLAKNLSFMAKADSAGIVLGARVPIVLTSRANSLRARLASCAVAVLYADARRRALAATAA